MTTSKRKDELRERIKFVLEAEEGLKRYGDLDDNDVDEDNRGQDVDVSLSMIHVMSA